MVEYWKSAPYTLSYLGGHGYQIRAGLPIRASGKGSARASSAEVRLSLRGSSALIPWEDIRLYRELDPANGRLQGLWEDLLDAGAHRLLWLPPAAPYYRYPEGRFDDDTARALTKRLVFSAWALVPTAISTLTSYEVERRLRDEEAATRTRRSDTETFYDTESNARHVRHLRMDGSGPSMTVLPLVLPSPALAALCDPLSLSAELGSAHGLPTWSMVKSQAVARIREALALILPEAPRRKNGSAAWYSLAPMLLDSLSASSAAYDPELTVAPRTDDVAQQGQLQGALVDLQDMLAKALDSMFREDDGGLTARVSDRSLPAVPTNLEEVLAEIALASPSYAILRALRRSFPDLDVSGLVDATMVASMGMLSLLNSWEGTHIVRASGRRKYWRQALAYCAEGHLQAVMDEYVAALFEWQGRDREADGAKALMATARDLAAAMTLRTTVYDVLRPDGGQLTPQPMRGRFAVRFGDARSEDAGDMRSQAVSLSFNSPFWPFVLATTSVGQEGLDFHLYCHAVSHWNLPSNPVDLEQREGRVHRYKGHAIRKNVATAFGPPSGAGEPWSELFQRALDATEEGRESEIVPFWVFTPEGEGVPAARIERHLPIMPLSREASRRDPLLASVAYYRLAFGQPRQTDLVDFVLNRIEDDQVREELRDLRVDLSPPRRGA
jgi:hypothetical protein